MSRISLKSINNIKNEFIEHSDFGMWKIENNLVNLGSVDVTFVIEHKHISIHRKILISRCEYFRAMLSGGFAESHESVIELDVKLEPFKIVLDYLYVGRICVLNYSDDMLIDCLVLAHEYGCKDFIFCLIGILSKRMNLNNVYLFTRTSKFYDFNDFTTKCFDFIDANADALLKHHSFKSLSKELLSEIICRDSFATDNEVDLFKAITVWGKNQTMADLKFVLKFVRFTLMQVQEIQNVVKDTKLLSTTKLNRIINKIKTSYDLPFREGFKHRLLMQYFRCFKNKYFIPPLEAIDEPIMFKLSTPQIINYIEMYYYDELSYYIEISSDQRNWIRIIDYSKYICRNHQILYFDLIFAEYIYVKPVFCGYKSIFPTYFSIYIGEEKFALPKVVNGVIAIDKKLLNKHRKMLSTFEYKSKCDKNACIITLYQPFYINCLRVCRVNLELLKSIEIRSDETTFKILKFVRDPVQKNLFIFDPQAAYEIKIVYSINISSICHTFQPYFDCDKQNYFQTN